MEADYKQLLFLINLKKENPEEYQTLMDGIVVVMRDLHEAVSKTFP